MITHKQLILSIMLLMSSLICTTQSHAGIVEAAAQKAAYIATLCGKILGLDKVDIKQRAAALAAHSAQIKQVQQNRQNQPTTTTKSPANTSKTLNPYIIHILTMRAYLPTLLMGGYNFSPASFKTIILLKAI